MSHATVLLGWGYKVVDMEFYSADVSCKGAFCLAYGS